MSDSQDYSPTNLDLYNKIELLGDEHKQILNRFLDLFFVENSRAIRKTVSKNISELSEKIAEFACEQGMTEEFAEKLLKEIS